MNIVKKLFKIQPKTPKVIVLGNGKAGTSAIATLLAEYAGLSKTIDIPELWHPTFTSMLNGEITLKLVVEKYPKPFKNQLVKEPCLTFFARQVVEVFPNAKKIFILRDPRDNVRSILNRLKVPGNLENIELDQYHMPTAWKAVFISGPGTRKQGSYIEILARQWCESLKNYEQFQDKFILLKYESFLADKLATIEKLAKTLNLDKKTDISPLLDKPFQPKGDNTATWQEFYGLNNLEKIEKICTDYLSRYGYKPSTNDIL